MGRYSATTCLAADHRRWQAGGLLLEVSLVLLVVGLLTVATFEIHSAMRQRQQTTDARHVLQALDAAVRVFAIREQRLPCPDTGVDGLEAGGVAGCLALAGGVPFITLGIEAPRLPKGLVLRYGVAPALFGTSEPRFLVRALAASRLSEGTSQPYVAARDSAQFFSDCSVAALNPAYVLMWMPRGAEQATPPLCFRESSDGAMGVMAVGRVELLGWLRSTL